MTLPMVGAVVAPRVEESLNQAPATRPEVVELFVGMKEIFKFRSRHSVKQTARALIGLLNKLANKMFEMVDPGPIQIGLAVNVELVRVGPVGF